MSAAAFVQRWRQRAAECSDPFDQFFSAWIALVIAARDYLDQKNLPQPDRDRKAIIQYFELRAQLVAAVLGSLRDQVAISRAETLTRAAALLRDFPNS